MSGPGDSIRRLKQKGSRVAGCFPLYPPVELLHSLGLVPLVLWGLNDEVTSFEESDRHLQGFACSVARRLTEFALSEEGGLLDCLFMYNACDTLRNMPEILLRGLAEKGRSLPVFRLHVPMAPASQTDSAPYFAARMEELVRSMETAFRVRFSSDTFMESIKIYNKMRGLARHLEALVAEGRVPYALFSRAIRDGYFMPVEEHVARLRDEIGRAGAAPAAGKKDARRIIISGILPPTDALCAIIEGAGLRVAGNDVACQARSYGYSPAATGDPVAFYADLYRNHPPCTTLLYSSDDRIRALVGLAEERKAQGVVFIGEKFCEYEYLELPYVRKVLAEKGIPDLQLEIGADDSYNVEALRTRVEAFAELIR
jgi:benzoyl-CoA reductase/2-hydroxyglutaryl-CoA dehydratase subunit BcrC/BadD/HgdB